MYLYIYYMYLYIYMIYVYLCRYQSTPRDPPVGFHFPNLFQLRNFRLKLWNERNVEHFGEQAGLGSDEATAFGPVWRLLIPETETNSEFAPQNGPKRPKRQTKKYSNHPFSGAFAVSFRDGIRVTMKKYPYRPLKGTMGGHGER